MHESTTASTPGRSAREKPVPLLHLPGFSGKLSAKIDQHRFLLHSTFCRLRHGACPRKEANQFFHPLVGPLGDGDTSGTPGQSERALLLEQLSLSLVSSPEVNPFKVGENAQPETMLSAQVHLDSR